VLPVSSDEPGIDDTAARRRSDELGLARRIGAVLAIDAGAQAIEFEDRWHTWREVAQTVDDVTEALEELGAGDGTPVGVLLRNRPASIGLLLGVLRARACVVVINPALGPHRVADDLRTLDLALLAGETRDIDALVDPSIAARVPILSTANLGGPARFTVPPGAVFERAMDGGSQPPRDTAVRMTTSGTTGPPKRVDLSVHTFEKIMRGAPPNGAHPDRVKASDADARDEIRLRDDVVIVHAPLVHVAGVYRVLQAVLDGCRMALLERFTVEGWAECVRRHRPVRASLVPSAVRMVLDAELDPRDLSSLRSVVSGTAPLAPELADAFTARYGVPVLPVYGATEFAGGVAGWTLAEHERCAAEKRGSVGRAHDGCALRIVDQETDAVLPPGEVGLLEVQAHQLGPVWVRTNDLGRLDADGFLWVVGRADQTILRGGLKVQPEVVQAALERHPGVRSAAVVGIEHERLGRVPVAAVEAVGKPNGAGRGEPTLDPDDVLAHAAPFLARYEIPVEVVVVDELPRTVSGKADLVAVRALFEH
jgi:acyl-CoA synthetase (AMP-forming)/AMP-acid ligase II